MSVTFYPQINSETSLPIYVTGVGIGLDMSSDSPIPPSDSRLLISVKGEGSVTVGDETVELSEGHGLFLDRSVHFSSAANGEAWELDWISFRITSGELKDSLFTRHGYVSLRIRHPEILSEDIRKILEALTRDTVYGGHFASAILYTMLIEINRDELDIPRSQEKGNGAITSAISYINAHYAENLSLEELCKVAGGLSEQYFCRLFKQHTGARPIEYILRKRINVARSYLEKTDMPISHIARLTGFNNSSYFYRNFKKFTGVSPLACRQGAMDMDVIPAISTDE